MKYLVGITYLVYQTIEVEAGDVDEAMDIALDLADEPNISNKFELDTDPEVVAVDDANGKEVWCRP